jgi:hypothetical protein
MRSSGVQRAIKSLLMDGRIAAPKNERSSAMMLAVDAMLRFALDDRSACYLTITQAFIAFRLECISVR